MYIKRKKDVVVNANKKHSFFFGIEILVINKNKWYTILIKFLRYI